MDSPDQAALAPWLKTCRLGRRYYWLQETPSTNRDAMALIRLDAPEGTTVAANHQTAGRGRMARSWFSPPGMNLYVSVILRPVIEDPARIATLPLVAGLALAEAIEKLAPQTRPLIKWPNDIWIGRKKVCGILCEMKSGTNELPAIVLGFGLNVNLPGDGLPPELSPCVTSLRMEAFRTFSRAEVLGAALNALEARYDCWQTFGFTPFLSELNRRDLLRGTRVSMTLTGKPLTGIAEGIRPDGGLNLRGDDGLETAVYSGEAHIEKSTPLSTPC